MMSDHTNQLAHANLLLQSEMEHLLAAERCLSGHNSALSRCIGEHKSKGLRSKALSPQSLDQAADLAANSKCDTDSQIMTSFEASAADTERELARAARMAVEALCIMGTAPGSSSLLQTGEF